jgi:hypothetical protein
MLGPKRSKLGTGEPVPRNVTVIDCPWAQIGEQRSKNTVVVLLSKLTRRHSSQRRLPTAPRETLMGNRVAPSIKVNDNSSPLSAAGQVMPEGLGWIPSAKVEQIETES